MVEMFKAEQIAEFNTGRKLKPELAQPDLQLFYAGGRKHMNITNIHRESNRIKKIRTRKRVAMHGRHYILFVNHIVTIKKNFIYIPLKSTKVHIWELRVFRI